MTAYLIVIYTICTLFVVLNFKHDLHMLQQNSYRIPRYWRYLRQGDWMSAWRLVDVAVLFLLFSTLGAMRFNELVVALVCLTQGFLVMRRKFKKPLVFTKRVWRLYSVCAALAVGCVVCLGVCLGMRQDAWFQYSGVQITLGSVLLMAIFSWALVIAAVVILMPVEKCINDRYRREAASILKSMHDLTVVGITGSYGKTSTKHYLYRILSEEYEVLMTPGSYNTTMGVIRTVRECLKPYQKIFICEMGAKQVGDVKEICDLVHPEIGIVTAVGPMHLETFKSIENVQRTKFELVDALPSDGLAVVNNDFPMCASREVNNVPVVRYSASADDAGSQWRASDIEYSPEGTRFTVNGPEGESFSLDTKLVGECNISNILAAVIVALRLGVSVEKIQVAVRSLEQVEHRLNVSRTPGGVTIIDDAFNSNPAGSKMAVDVLAGFSGGRRIIVTPGMVELGHAQHDLNRELGVHIGKSVDVAVVVGQVNRSALADGIREGMENGVMKEDGLHIVDTFADSQQFLAGFLRSGDTVLYENDLPDSFK